MQLGCARHRLDLVLGRPGSTVTNVVSDGIIKQHRVLGHDADRRAQTRLRDAAQILTIDGDAPAVDIVEAIQQSRQRRLSSARTTDHRHRCARGDRERHITQNLPSRFVGKRDILETHFGANRPRFAGLSQVQRRRAGEVIDLPIGIEHAEHLLDIGQALLDLAVEHAQEVQRNVELDHEGVDQHQIAQRHPALDHADGGAPDHHRDGCRDNRALPCVEQ